MMRIPVREDWFGSCGKQGFLISVGWVFKSSMKKKKMSSWDGKEHCIFGKLYHSHVMD